MYKYIKFLPTQFGYDLIFLQYNERTIAPSPTHFFPCSFAPLLVRFIPVPGDIEVLKELFLRYPIPFAVPLSPLSLKSLQAPLLQKTGSHVGLRRTHTHTPISLNLTLQVLSLPDATAQDRPGRQYPWTPRSTSSSETERRKTKVGWGEIRRRFTVILSVTEQIACVTLTALVVK